MKRSIIETADGSKTIQLEEWQEQYHSKHGAVQEAYHVFIKYGLDQLNLNELNILEIGFGTGLNALITLIEAQKKSIAVHYTGVEQYPVTWEEVHQLDYITSLSAQAFENEFDKMHKCEWEKEVVLTNNFLLTKQKKDFRAVKNLDLFNLIYFDAFGPRVQPELWAKDVFQIMYDALRMGGVLVTYSAKGSVRRAMQEVGFSVERLEGPPGKREMLRANKISSIAK
ncbi:tRNA (5-methylaminomethyl-2-thiouridine)(34)-methyltransferase MnmD [Flagellimonas sp. S174]|uniref:tRNA (5-methylaminomethyl-2-thiouridine)(34)-methyltransferase MnmD n=1 Tax=Flagellimonas sp. S174 TaxID=3410790 RepID=UPI003BF4FBF6